MKNKLFWPLRLASQMIFGFALCIILLPKLALAQSMNTQVSGIIKSTLTGGDWTLPATWQGNIVPTVNDSVEITEGSTVLVPYALQYNTFRKWLRIGGTDTTKQAILNLNNGLSLQDKLYLGKGDFIVGKQSNGSLYNERVVFSLYKDWKLDGDVNVKYLGLYFYGNNPITMDGAGSITQNRFFGISNLNKAEVNLHFGGNIEGLLAMDYGKLKFHKPVTYKIRNPGGPNVSFGITNKISRFNGTFEGPLNFTMPSDFIELNGIISYYYGMPDYTTGVNPADDTLTGPGKEFLNTKAMRLINIKRGTKNNVFYFDSTISMAQVTTSTFGTIRMRNPQDTLFAWYFSIGSSDTSARNCMDQGNLCLWNDPAFQKTLNQGASSSFMCVKRNGRQRLILLRGAWWEVPGQKLCMEVVPSTPTGPVEAPIANVGGYSILQLNSSLPIPAGKLSISLYYHASDNMLFNPLDLVIAQGPTPNGPWRLASKPVNTTSNFRISDTIDFAHGYYFCWATTSKGIDMAANNFIVPHKYYETGCADVPPQKIGVVIQNKAIAYAQSFAVGYQMEGGPIQDQYINYSLAERLKPLQKDTIWFSGDQGQALPIAGKYKFTAWVKQIDDTVTGNDTIKVSADYQPISFPYFNDFDTIATTTPGFGNLRNIPFRWYDSLYYKAWINVGAGSNQPAIGAFEVESPNGPSPGPGAKRNLQKSVTGSRPYEHSILTNRIGPIQKPALIEFKYRNIISGFPPTLTDITAGDTVYVEGSEDCGSNWKGMFKIHNMNRPLSLNMGWFRDSLTFSNGSFVILRFRIKLPSGFNVFPTVEFDSLRLYAGTLTTGTQDLQQVAEQIQVYPNPNSGKVEVVVPSTWIKRTRFQILDVQGKTVQEGRLENNKIEFLSTVPNGLYLVRIQTGDKWFGKRIILER